MKPKLYLEIDKSNLNFFVVEDDYQDDFKISYKFKTPLVGLKDSRVTDNDKFFSCIKEGIYLIEKKFNFTFKEIILILENFNPTFINLTGYKKLNSSQVLKENITYILNTLKSCVDEIEFLKTVVHIFNSKFFLDNKKIENLPIGLFGDFYSHELSFVLINKNEHKNIKNILEKCNLNTKKIFIKSFIENAYLSNKNKNSETFFNIKLDNNNTKISYFENNALKFEESFSFGSEIIISDISKITSIKKENIKFILENIKLDSNMDKNELLEKELFKDDVYKKIKKKLIYEIIIARIQEILEIILFKNKNLSYYKNFTKTIFFEFKDKLLKQSLEEIYKTVFSSNDNFHLSIVDDLSDENILFTANRLVHFGWKKEAIPITRTKKSLIARFFNAIFR
jgi:cell division protein FtsA